MKEILLEQSPGRYMGFRKLSPYFQPYGSITQPIEPEEKTEIFDQLMTSISLMHQALPAEDDLRTTRQLLDRLALHSLPFGRGRFRQLLKALSDVRNDALPPLRERDDLILMLDHRIPCLLLDQRAELVGQSNRIGRARAAEQAKRTSQDAATVRDVPSTDRLAAARAAAGTWVPDDGTPDQLRDILRGLDRGNKAKTINTVLLRVFHRLVALRDSLKLSTLEELIDALRGIPRCNKVLGLLVGLYEERFSALDKHEARRACADLEERLRSATELRPVEIGLTVRCLLKHLTPEPTAVELRLLETLKTFYEALSLPTDLEQVLGHSRPLMAHSCGLPLLKTLAERFQACGDIDKPLRRWAVHLEKSAEFDPIEAVLALQCSANRGATEGGSAIRSAIKPYLRGNSVHGAALASAFKRLGMPPSEELARSILDNYGIDFTGGSGATMVTTRQDLMTQVKEALQELRAVAGEASALRGPDGLPILRYRNAPVYAFNAFLDILITECTAWAALHAAGIVVRSNANTGAPGELHFLGMPITLFQLPTLLREYIEQEKALDAAASPI